MFTPFRSIGTAFEDFIVTSDGEDTFVLGYPPKSSDKMMVCVNGDQRMPTTGFTLAGSTVTLVTPDPLTGDIVRVFYI